MKMSRLNKQNRLFLLALLVSLFCVLIAVPLCSSLVSAKLDLSPTSLDFELNPGDSSYKTFTLTYTNTLPVEFNGNFTYSDPDPDVEMSLNVTTFTLDPGDSIKVKVTIDVDDTADEGTYSEDVEIWDTDANTKEEELDVNVDVGSGERQYCKDGKQGDYLFLNIESPDSGDDIYAGSNVTVEVEIENDHTKNLDVVVEVDLYDLTDEKSVVDAEKKTTINDGDSKTIMLSLKVPSTVDVNNDFAIYAKVYEEGNEDDQCYEDVVDVEVKKVTHKISVDSLDVSPETVACGDYFNVSLRVNNLGSSDEDIKISIKNSDLNVDYSKTLVLDADESYIGYFEFLVPTDATEKTHSVAVTVYYGINYGSSVKNTVNVVVKGKCFVEVKDVAIALQTVGDAFIGQEVSVKVTLTNTGNVPITYAIEASDYGSWASLVKIEPQNVTVEGGSVGYAYITLLPFENASGSNTFKAKITFDSTTKEETLAIVLRKQTFSAKWFEQLGFEIRRNWYWLIIDIVLVAALIVFLVLWLKLKSHTKRVLGEPKTEIKVRTISEKEFKKK